MLLQQPNNSTAQKINKNDRKLRRKAFPNSQRRSGGDLKILRRRMGGVIPLFRQEYAACLQGLHQHRSSPLSRSQSILAIVVTALSFVQLIFTQPFGTERPATRTRSPPIPGGQAWQSQCSARENGPCCGKSSGLNPLSRSLPAFWRPIQKLLFTPSNLVPACSAVQRRKGKP